MGDAWVSLDISGSSSVNSVSFNLDFSGSSSGLGLVSVYWNGEQIGTIDESNVLPGAQTYTFGVTDSGNSQGNVLSFRLDDFAAMPSIVNISDIQTQFEGFTGSFGLNIAGGGVGGGINLTVSGVLGASYIIESSSDLINWTSMATVGMESGTSATVSDPDAGNNPSRFYRLIVP
jgi:hypothetical protein